MRLGPVRLFVPAAKRERGSRFRLPSALAAIILVLAGCAPRPPIPRPPAAPAWPVAPLRVALLAGTSSAEVRLDEGGRFLWDGGRLEIAPGERARLIAREEIYLKRGENEERLAAAVTLLPEDDSPFWLDGRLYGGTLDLFCEDGQLLAVNRIGLERYLRGVVPWEIGFQGEEKLEAVKAQAVAARTYALTRIRSSSEPWDILADETDQVYRGLERTSPVIDRAIEETAGLVATHGGKLLRTYYSSTCGGRTARLEEVWLDREGAPYLRGLPDGPGRSPDPSRAFCRGSPFFRWSEKWSGEDEVAAVVEKLAAEWGLDPSRLGRLKDVKIEKRGRSGRVHTVTFYTEGGKVKIGGDRVRWVLIRPGDGGGILRSASFDIKVKRSQGFVREIRAEGRGFGHGVGMCQWGAMGMAESGYSFEQILKHYYPGLRLSGITQKLLAAR